ncbi:hypothetical protein H0H92_000564 [Tricholoma furcatifolium]|nr:hypothetical protein H0H92_000564 [Tricholoma furcatifolium]
MLFEYPDEINQEPGWEDHLPLELKDFADSIDYRGGYLHSIAEGISDFAKELVEARDQEQHLRGAILEQAKAAHVALNPVAVLALSTPLLPDESIVRDEEVSEKYSETHRTAKGQDLDKLLPFIQDWLRNPGKDPPSIEGLSVERFKRLARQFFFSMKGRFYRRGEGGKHKLVINKDK